MYTCPLVCPHYIFCVHFLSIPFYTSKLNVGNLINVIFIQMLCRMDIFASFCRRYISYRKINHFQYVGNFCTSLCVRIVNDLSYLNLILLGCNSYSGNIFTFRLRLNCFSKSKSNGAISHLDVPSYNDKALTVYYCIVN